MSNTREAQRLVFISYGGKIDAKIAELLCEFLVSFLGRKDAVYCTATSDNKTSTPYGEDFSESYMHNIQESKVFIPLLSENYMQSNTAMIEMGAAYALNIKFIPFLVSGCDYNKLQPLYNIRNYDMYAIDDLVRFTKAMNEINSCLGTNNPVSDEKCKEFIKRIKKLKTGHKTNVYKQKQIKFICDKLFSDDEKFNNLKKLLSEQKVIDINIVNYTNGKISDCYFYFKDAKNVSDLISVLDELGYTDDEYKLIEIGGRL